MACAGARQSAPPARAVRLCTLTRARAVQGGKAMRVAAGTKRTFIRPAYNLAKKVMPKISDTEAAALSSGTVTCLSKFR